MTLRIFLFSGRGMVATLVAAVVGGTVLSAEQQQFAATVVANLRL